MAENGFTEQQIEPSGSTSDIETMVAPGRMSDSPNDDNHTYSDAVTLPNRTEQAFVICPFPSSDTIRSLLTEQALRMFAFWNLYASTLPVATALGMVGLPSYDNNIHLNAIARANLTEQALRMFAFRNLYASTLPVATALGMVGLPSDDNNINLNAITRANLIEQALRMFAFQNLYAITLPVATALRMFGLPNDDTNINLDAITRAILTEQALRMSAFRNSDAITSPVATAVRMFGLPNDDTNINLDAITQANRTEQASRMLDLPVLDAITSANTESMTDYTDRRGQGYAPVPPLASTLDPEHVAITILDPEDAHVPKKALNTKAALLSGVRETVVVATAVPLIAVAFDNIRDYPELYPTNSRDWVRVTGFGFLTLNTLMFLAGSYMVMDFTRSKLSGDPKAFYVKSFLATVMGLACLIFALMVYRCVS